MTAYEAGFPKQMKHPQFMPGEIWAEGRDIAGTAMRFPPVLAESSMMEENLRSRGYLGPGEAPKVIDYYEYPLMLQHPDHVDGVPATTGGTVKDGMLVTYPIAAVPEVYPHVVVNSPKEEAEWEAKGYRRPGKADDLAFERQRNAPGMPGAEWPKWVDTGKLDEYGKPVRILMQDPDTPAPGPAQYPMYIRLPSGQEIIVKDRADHERQCGPLNDSPAPPKPEPVEPSPYSDEWVEFQAFKAWKAAQEPSKLNFVPPEFILKEEADTPADDIGSSLEALRARATELGIAYDGRWSERRLQREIERKTGGTGLT